MLEAYYHGRPVVISYQDARWRRTSRMIEPLELEADPYTGIVKIKAYCYLRDDERTFLLDRITMAASRKPTVLTVGGIEDHFSSALARMIYH